MDPGNAMGGPQPTLLIFAHMPLDFIAPVQTVGSDLL